MKAAAGITPASSVGQAASSYAGRSVECQVQLALYDEVQRMPRAEGQSELLDPGHVRRLRGRWESEAGSADLVVPRHRVLVVPPHSGVDAHEPLAGEHRLRDPEVTCLRPGEGPRPQRLRYLAHPTTPVRCRAGCAAPRLICGAGIPEPSCGGFPVQWR